jgi:glutathione S-transferase
VSRMARANLARHKRAGGAAASRFTVVRFGAGSSRAAERARGRVLAALDRLEAELGDEDYLVGGRFRRGYRWVEEMFRRHRRPA